MELIDAVTVQMNEEIGELEISFTEKYMLRMKYGLSAPRLTPSEQFLIKKEAAK